MRYCERCDTEYEPGEHCMCVIYRKRMEDGLEFMVPQWWIREHWEGPTWYGYNHPEGEPYNPPPPLWGE